MNLMKRTGLKLLGLCVLALGLVAFSASAAQAEGTWMVNNTNLTSGSKALAGTLDSPGGTLLATIGANVYQFTCTAGELLNAKLEAGGAISEANKDAKVDFSGCTTTVNGTLAPKCVPVDGATNGVILSREWYGLLTLHKLENGTKDGVVVVTPKVGTVLALIALPDSCAFPTHLEVSGPLALHDVGVELNKDECETERANHLVSEFAPLTKLTVSNEKGSGVGTLDGMADIKLVTGENWSCLP